MPATHLTCYSHLGLYQCDCDLHKFGSIACKATACIFHSRKSAVSVISKRRQHQHALRYLAAIQDGPVASASAKVAIKGLLHLHWRALFSFALRNGESRMAGNNHPRGAKAALGAVETSNALCKPQR